MLTTAKCTCCGAVHYTADMFVTPMANRGGRNAYMCRTCATTNRWYHTSNTEIQGKPKANKVQCGTEWETSYNNMYARNALFEFGAIPTNDSSLHGRRTCEFVTGIQQGLNITSKMAVTIEKLLQEGHLEMNDSCGTHFHVSIDNMEDEFGFQNYMSYIREYYKAIFTPLCKAMQQNRTKTTALFGRYFNTDYAEPICEWMTADNRYLFINATNNSNIEFRINKFKTAKQWQALVKMEVEMVQTIVTNFCEHYNDMHIDSRRYPTQERYRKHKAEVTAKKLVKLFEKYTANI